MFPKYVVVTGSNQNVHIGAYLVSNETKQFLISPLPHKKNYLNENNFQLDVGLDTCNQKMHTQKMEAWESGV